ncbi:sodium-translocating pyrophosphatase [Candidatus Woesearchaeota archaeon]|nr:sodium-translocating pyrophosphatase [Candidatus Woesearchaeota archaeon]
MIIAIAIIIALLALIFAVWKAFWVLSKPRGSKQMIEISEAIRQGAKAFLNKEYQVLIVFAVIVAALLWIFLSWQLSIAFVFGALFSAMAGNFGMRIATQANVRTANACKKNLGKGLSIAFNSGLVMGLTVVGLGLLGVSVLYLIFKDPKIIYGFGFGASSIALFARVGGGIYTKAADVGADLVGKVEKGIPEDDPRNPAVIADNVGDNVGDVAGMGADLFESFVDSIIAAMVLGTILGKQYVFMPLALAAAGIASAVIGSFFVKLKTNKASASLASKALNKGILTTSLLVLVLTIALAKLVVNDLNIAWAAISGLIAGVIIGLSTEYYTSPDRKPAQSIAKAATTGAGTNIIQGLAIGMLSTLIPVIVVVAAIIIAFKTASLYGVAIAAVGMLSTLGITLAADTYGPVADNAAGIAEMAGLGELVRKRAETLDAVGNTTAAVGKGFAIGSAALTALALFASFSQVTGITSIDISKPEVISGLMLGVALPFLFSALTMQAVGKAAKAMVEEVRRQFKTIKGLMQGKAKPDYARCVKISTESALKQMILPSLIAILSPVIVGALLGLEALGGLLAGVTASGFLLAVFMANAGGAWDNAKKFIEEGNLGGKGSAAHKAAVVGDTVGDPFKDTSGPSLNILIKLISIVAIVVAPLLLA